MSSLQEFIEKWTRVVQTQPPRAVRSGNRVDYLTNGKAAFEAMYQAILTTLGGDATTYYVYFLGWWLDDDFLLNTPTSASGDKLDPNSSFYNLMRRAAIQTRPAEVRVMLWDNLLNPAVPILYPRGVRWQALRINQLPLAAAIVDGNNLPLQSHHQKLLVVNGRQGLVGFCGGMDIAEDRVRSVPLHKGSPFHDVHCRIQGDAVYDLLDVFVQRWNASPDVSKLPKERRALRATQSASSSSKNTGDQYVGILRTFIPNPDACIKEASIGPTILDAIRTSTRFIYVEDQYMMDAEARSATGDLYKDGVTYKGLASALGERLNNLQHITLLIPHSTISDMPMVWKARLEFIEGILKKADGQTRSAVDNAVSKQKAGVALKPPYPKLRVFFRYVGTKPINSQSKYKPDDFGPGSYVHSKTWIFDDELAIIGSANCNRRGWNYDSEVAAAIFDYAPNSGVGHSSFAQRLRISLWAKHLHLKEDDGRILNGIETQGSASAWFEEDASKYVRLYDPREDKDSAVSELFFPLGEPEGSRKGYHFCVSRGKGLLTGMQREAG